MMIDLTLTYASLFWILPTLGIVAFLRAAFDPAYGDYEKPDEVGTLFKAATDRFELTRPLMEDATGQFQSILNQGNLGATLPLVSKAMESSRLAGSRTLQDTSENLSRQGITGSERARTMSQVAQTNNMNISQIPFLTLMPMIQQLFSSVLGQSAMGMQGMAAGANMTNQGQLQQLAGRQALQQKFADLMNSMAVMGMGSA